MANPLSLPSCNHAAALLAAAIASMAKTAKQVTALSVSPRHASEWYRNVFSHVPSTKVREIAAMLKAIHASEDIAAAREKAVRVIEKLRASRLTIAAELAEAAVEETLRPRDT
jgi:hypothetical protein